MSSSELCINVGSRFVLWHSEGFDKCSIMYAPLQYHTDQFNNPNISLWVIYSTSPSSCWATTHVFSVSMVWTFPKCHIHRIIQYVAFLDWLLSLPNIYFKFICVFPCRLGSSFLTITELRIPIYRCTDLFIHSPIEGYLGCPQFETITNKAAKNIHVQVLCGHKFSCQLYKYLGTRLLGHLS